MNSFDNKKNLFQICPVNVSKLKNYFLFCMQKLLSGPNLSNSTSNYAQRVYSVYCQICYALRISSFLRSLASYELGWRHLIIISLNTIIKSLAMNIAFIYTKIFHALKHHFYSSTYSGKIPQ